MKSHGPQPNNDISCEGDQVYLRDSITKTVADAQKAQVHEDDVCDCVEELCDVRSDVVVLVPVSDMFVYTQSRGVVTPLHTSSM